MSTGFVLNIPQEMLNRLEDADKKIEKLAKTSEDAQTRIVSAFKSINTHGIDAFINKLTEAQNAIQGLSNVELNIKSGGFEGVKRGVAEVSDELQKLNELQEKHRQKSEEIAAVEKREKEYIENKARLQKEYFEAKRKHEAESAKLDAMPLPWTGEFFEDTLKRYEQTLKRVKKEAQQPDLFKIDAEELLREVEIRKEELKFLKSIRAEEDAIEKTRQRYRSQKQNVVEPLEQSYEQAKAALNTLESSKKAEKGLYRLRGELQEIEKQIEKAEAAYGRSVILGGKQQGVVQTPVATVTEQSAVAIDAINKLIDAINKLHSIQGKGAPSSSSSSSTMTDAEKERKAYVETYEMYKRMFDQIERKRVAKEKAAEKEAKAAEASAEREARAAEKAAERERKAYEKAYKERAKQYQEANRKQLSTYGGAMDFSQNAHTINRMVQAIKYLQVARDGLSNTDSQYTQKVKALNDEIKRQKAEIDKVRSGAKELQKEHRNLMDISGQLARKLALVFSVSQITGYVKKLIEVRGEFELQQRSLQAILQNKDEANRIWQQTVDLAVRSPFRVKELVSYTKQLAAYRIESDKLFETNKMLADISAGLGVDMQRLILAFGQVRSAAYLRGTELRQFTEAGIPILEQLAQYFTELEGRAVSVGDVFERVSKRMVSFADVEEIFRRMTSEGGTFYRMQEIQAETLQGQISNLKDSVDIMLNEIGKANEATLKNSVAMVRNFVENWEEVAAVIGHVLKILSPLLATMALVKLGSSSLGKTVASLATGLWNFAGSIQKVGVGMTGLSIKTAMATKAVQTLKTALIGLGSGVATVALSAFVYWCLEVWRKSTEAERSIKKLNGALEEIYTQDTSTLKTQIRGFENLVGRLKEANENTRERREIISQINSQYGEYLGFIVDEKTSYEQLANSIDSVTLALTRRAKATSFEKALAEVYGKTNETIAESEKVLRDTMDDIFGTQVDGKALSLLPNEEEIIKIFDLIDKKTIELGRPLESSEIREVLEVFYGYFVSFNTTQKEAADFMSAIERRGQAVLTQREKELEIDRRINEVYKDNAESAAEATKAFKELEERRTAALSDAKGAPKWQVEKIKRDFEIEKIDLQVKYEGLDEATADLRKKTLESMNATVNDINKKIEGSISKLGEKYANLIYIDETEAATGVNQIAENTAAAYKAQKEILKQQNSLKEAGTAYDADILKNAQKSADAYYYKLQLLGRLDLLQKETAKEETKEMKLLRQQLAALKEAGQTYQNLRKDFDMTTATKKTASAFKDLFAELKMTDLTKEMSFDELGILKVLEELPNKAGDAGKKAIEKLRAEFLSERDVEAQRKRSKLLLASIQEEFDQYDLSLELKKLNIPPDLAKSLFDVDYLDLEGLKKAVQEQEAKFVGTDMEDEYKKFLEKINDLSRKQREDEAKEFVNFLKKNLDEIKLIQDKGAYNIALADRLFGEGKITAEQYMLSVRQIINDTNKEVGKINFEKLKDSATYIKAMGNLAAYSQRELKGMAKLLEDMIAKGSKDMSVDEIKAIYEALEKINKESEKFEPIFRQEELSNIAEYLKLQKQYEDEQKKHQHLLSQEIALKEKAYEIEKKLAELRLLLIEAEKSGDSKSITDILGKIAGLQSEAKGTESALGGVQNQLAGSASILSNMSGQMGSILGGANATVAIIDMIVKAIYQSVKATVQIFREIKELSDSFGAETEKGNWREANKFFEGMENFNEKVMSGWENLKSGNAMGAIADTIGTWTGFIRDINKWIDSNRQEEIDNEIENIERLEKEYERLNKDIDEAYSIKRLQEYNEELVNNIELQKASYRAMIAAEEAKKDTDPKQVEAWDEELAKLEETLSDIENTKLEGLGGVTDFRGQTRSFVDAWVSAYKETGNGLKGLQENFRDFFDNIIAEQAALRVTEKFLEPFYGSLNDALKDYELTAKESQDLREEADKIMPELSKALELIWAELGGSIGEAEAGKLSALQKGIQGMTEDQAEILTAYWNSVRGYTASIDSKMDLVLANLGVGAEDNPMLEQMRLVAKNTSAINTLLNSLVKSGHTQGGLGLKVFMD